MRCVRLTVRDALTTVERCHQKNSNNNHSCRGRSPARRKKNSCRVSCVFVSLPSPHRPESINMILVQILVRNASPSSASALLHRRRHRAASQPTAAASAADAAAAGRLRVRLRGSGAPGAHESGEGAPVGRLEQRRRQAQVGEGGEARQRAAGRCEGHDLRVRPLIEARQRVLGGEGHSVRGRGGSHLRGTMKIWENKS